MAFYSIENWVNPQAIADTSTTQLLPLGTRIKANDTTYLGGEFIYLKGVASTTIGDVVIYDTNAGTTTRMVTGSRGPVAIAMSANVASQYGWYQIAGSAVVRAATIAANAVLYFAATGQVDDAVSATNKIEGMVSRTADGTPSAGFAICTIDRPSMNGNG